MPLVKPILQKPPNRPFRRMSRSHRPIEFYDYARQVPEFSTNCNFKVPRGMSSANTTSFLTSLDFGHESDYIDCLCYELFQRFRNKNEEVQQ